ncbi:MAG TPA: hypothetical protein VF166_07030 [Gemmatimonadaceae bacterium]
MSSDSALPRRRVLLALLAGIAAFCIVWIATAPPGPGLDPDSASYLNAAESLVRHGALRAPTFYDWASPDSTEPLAHFPPGMPTALAIPRALGASQPTAARLVEASAALVTAGSTLLLVGAAAGPLAGVLAMLMLFATPAVLETHLSILSEPLFYALLVVTLTLMVRAPDRPLRYGITAAVGSLVRYAGISLVGAAVLWAFALGTTLRERVRRAAIAALPTLFGYGAWLARTKYETGGGVREVGVYHGFMATVREGAATVAAWLAPSLDEGAVRTLVALVVLALLVALVVAAVRRRSIHDGATRRATSIPPHRLLAATLLLAGVYVTVVVLSRLFADGAIPFDNRILSPLILLVELAVVVSLAVWWRAPGTRALRVVAAAVLLAWWGASLASSWNDVSYMMENGSDYGDVQWRTSPLVAWARTDGARCALFTNHPTALYFQAHRLVRGTPLAQPLDTLRAFADTLVARGGALIAFDEPSGAFAVPPDSVLRALSLERIARLADGSVWVPASIASTAIGIPMDGATNGHARCGESSRFSTRRR